MGRFIVAMSTSMPSGKVVASADSMMMIMIIAMSKIRQWTPSSTPPRRGRWSASEGLVLDSQEERPEFDIRCWGRRKLVNGMQVFMTWKGSRVGTMSLNSQLSLHRSEDEMCQPGDRDDVDLMIPSVSSYSTRRSSLRWNRQQYASKRESWIFERRHLWNSYLLSFHVHI